MYVPDPSEYKHLGFEPYPVYCFQVNLKVNGIDDPNISMYCKSVSGLKSETEVTDYQEGGQNTYTHRLVGVTKWPNIVLKRGFSKSEGMIKWREQWVNGIGVRAKVGEILQLNTELAVVAKWSFLEGWPCKWELSEFDASKSELAIETLEIAHHGLTYTHFKNPMPLGSK